MNLNSGALYELLMEFYDVNSGPQRSLWPSQPQIRRALPRTGFHYNQGLAGKADERAELQELAWTVCSGRLMEGPGYRGQAHRVAEIRVDDLDLVAARRIPSPWRRHIASTVADPEASAMNSGVPHCRPVSTSSLVCHARGRCRPTLVPRAPKTAVFAC